MAGGSAKSGELFAEVLRRTRGLVITVDGNGCVESRDRPWGEWAPAGISTSAPMSVMRPFSNTMVPFSITSPAGGPTTLVAEIPRHPGAGHD